MAWSSFPETSGSVVPSGDGEGVWIAFRRGGFEACHRAVGGKGRLLDRPEPPNLIDSLQQRKRSAVVGDRKLAGDPRAGAS